MLVDESYFKNYYQNKLKGKIYICEHCNKEINITNKSKHLKIHEKKNNLIDNIINTDSNIIKEFILKNGSNKIFKKIVEYIENMS